MHKEVADLWVAALRSGEYSQTRGLLKDCDGYCCLGVLCDLHQRLTNEGEWDNDGYYHASDASDGSLPVGDVAEWAGLRRRGPSVQMPDGKPYSVAGLNDDLGYTFQQLADLIEDQWESM